MSTDRFDDQGPEETLAIVTGAGGALGQAYAQALSTTHHVRTVGIVRAQPQTKITNVEYRDGVDLLDAQKVLRTIETIGCRDALRILLVHPVGKFKFEDSPPDDIDQEVLLSNYATLEHVLYPIIAELRSKAAFTVCGFGSVSDKYDVPFWSSYTKAKNKLRTLLKGMAEHLLPSDRLVRSVIVNVSTTDTGNENVLRPHADKEHWLQPTKIVEQSLPTLLTHTGPYYQELDVIQQKPGFDPDLYYRDPKAVLEKWHREMGTQDEPK